MKPAVAGDRSSPQAVLGGEGPPSDSADRFAPDSFYPALITSSPGSVSELKLFSILGGKLIPLA